MNEHRGCSRFWCCCSHQKVKSDSDNDDKLGVEADDKILSELSTNTLPPLVFDLDNKPIQLYFPAHNLEKSLGQDPLKIDEEKFYRIIRMENFYYLVINKKKDGDQQPSPKTPEQQDLPSEEESLEHSVVFFESDSESEKKDISKEKPLFTGNRFGWKIHFSVNPVEIKRLWDIVHTLCIKHKISWTKVISPKDFNKVMKNYERQITIYISINTLSIAQWKSFLLECEAILQKNELQIANKPPVADKPITGSQYISYRNDLNPYDEKTYINQEDAQTLATKLNKPVYNLIADDDPFEGFSLDLSSQANRLNLTR